MKYTAEQYRDAASNLEKMSFYWPEVRLAGSEAARAWED